MLPASIRVRHIAEASSRLIMGRGLRIAKKECVHDRRSAPTYASRKTWARGNDGREVDRRAAVSCGAESGLAAAGGRRAENARAPPPPPRAFFLTPPPAAPHGKRHLSDPRG